METPIVDFARRYAAGSVSRLHMPGHKGQPFLGPEPLDLTEIAGADSLYEADGIIARSERNAAKLFGAAHTFYSAEGSSLCIRAMLRIAAQCSDSAKPRILAARNVHRSFVSACALLGLEADWLFPRGGGSSLCGCPVSPEQLRQAILEAQRKNGEKPAAVYLTSPDYLGTMPDSVSQERRLLVRHYGAEVRLVHDAGNIGDCIAECVRTAQQMAAEDPNVFIPQQFENEANPRVHRHHTALEIMEQVGGPIDGFCSGVGTGGTITGIGEVLKAQNPGITIWAVEPENAAILAGGTVGTHLQMGIGDGLIPKILNTKIYEHVCIISDEEAIRTAQNLARLEGLMCGISSGTNVAAAIRLAKELGRGKTVVTVLPDTAERYFTTPLFEQD